MIGVPLLVGQLLEHFSRSIVRLSYLLPRQPEGLQVRGFATRYSPPIIEKLAPGKSPLMSKRMDTWHSRSEAD